jgi:hypothetical protein
MTVSTTIGLSLAMTICTEEFKVLETIVVVNPVYVLELENDFLFIPHAPSHFVKCSFLHAAHS